MNTQNPRFSTFSFAVPFVGALLCSLLTVAEAALVKSEEIDLSSRSSSHASITSHGGSFTAEGWKSNGGQDHVVAKLNRAIRPNDWAAVELHITNFDLSRNKAGQITNFFGVYNTPNGKPASGTPGSYVSMRTKGPSGPEREGFACEKNGKYGQGFRVVYRPTSKGNKKESMGACGCQHPGNASKVYRIRMEFKSHRVLIYKDDVLIWGNPVFRRATAMSYIHAGHDAYGIAEYGSFAGVVYKKMIVFRDDGKAEAADSIFARDHIKLNVGGYDDMVPGWHGAVRYATKGRELQWSQAFSTEGVKNAAPLDVYKTMLQKNHHYDNGTVYQDSLEMIFPLRDGDWTVRLHWIDILLPRKRHINVDLNGKRVISDMDIRTEVGRHLLALVKDVPVSVSGGTGLTVVLYDRVKEDRYYDFFLNGIEMIKTGATPAIPATSTLRLSVPSRMARVDNSGALRITAPEPGTHTLRVIDAAGRCRISRAIDGSTSIQGLRPGWYMVNLHRDGTMRESEVCIRP